MHHNDDLHCFQVGILQILVCKSKFALFVLFSNKALNNSHVCDIFLNGGVKRVKLLLHKSEHREAKDYYQRDSCNKNRNCHRISNGKSGLNGNGHNQCRHQHTGGADSHSQDHIDEVLHLGDVVGKSCYQRTCRELVDVCKGKLLNLAENIKSKVCSKVNRCLRTEI